MGTYTNIILKSESLQLTRGEKLWDFILIWLDDKYLQLISLFQVKVMLRVGASGEGPFTSGTQTFSMDKRKKQVSLCETAAAAAPEDRKVGVAAPKMFAFDAIFSDDDSQVSNWRRKQILL